MAVPLSGIIGIGLKGSCWLSFRFFYTTTNDSFFFFFFSGSSWWCHTTTQCMDSYTYLFNVGSVDALSWCILVEVRLARLLQNIFIIQVRLPLKKKDFYKWFSNNRSYMVSLFQLRLPAYTQWGSSPAHQLDTGPLSWSNAQLGNQTALSRRFPPQTHLSKPSFWEVWITKCVRSIDASATSDDEDD